MRLDTRPRRRPLLERLGLRPDLDALLAPRLERRGDLVDLTAGWVAEEESRAMWRWLEGPD